MVTVELANGVTLLRVCMWILGILFYLSTKLLALFAIIHELIRMVVYIIPTKAELIITINSIFSVPSMENILSMFSLKAVGV